MPTRHHRFKFSSMPVLPAASKTQPPGRTAAARTSNSGRKKARTGKVLAVAFYQAYWQAAHQNQHCSIIESRNGRACCSLCRDVKLQVAVPGLILPNCAVHLCMAPCQDVDLLYMLLCRRLQLVVTAVLQALRPTACRWPQCVCHRQR